VSVKVGGKALSEGDYKLAPDSLTIPSPPSGSFQVEMPALLCVVRGGDASTGLWPVCTSVPGT
jgi:hypothetical protein